MNETLDQMVQNYKPENESENEENQNHDNNNQTTINAEESNIINVTSLSTWFRNNVQNFDNVFSVNATLRGVDSDKNLIMTVTDQNNPTSELRYPFVFREADKIPVLDLEGEEMFIFHNNTFQINYRYSDDIFIKTYNLRTGLGIIFCRIINDEKRIPIKIEKYSNKNSNKIKIPEDILNIPIEQILDQEVDIESIIIRYKQIKKFKDNFSTNRDVIDFFLDKQSKIQDINHLIQIDNIIASNF